MATADFVGGIHSKGSIIVQALLPTALDPICPLKVHQIQSILDLQRSRLLPQR